MIQALPERMSFEEFSEWYPENGRRYELHNGIVIEMQPTGSHELIAGFLAEELTLEIRTSKLPYTIPRTCLLKPHLPDSGYQPDVAVLNRKVLADEPLWEKASTIQSGKTIPLVIEVVSTNWQDDYAHKLVEYEAMGIVEYWIVDFRALGAVRYIGKPKQPTITVCHLIEGEYQMQRFITGQRLESSIFPDLELTTDAIFQAGGL
ncbi:Uma2 family endonuclease [Chroococcidiopsis sp. CCMEE 29]|uniref:Uma2 family endonuclease n=1 Tax=Chroococcidiopsis sp. CCMEE 29 TaxID=155894 RepID=UPI0020223021|nr:Uma2 family endonuclease [Chroococcidiopsis sp. CCMEE 29]